MKRWLIFLFIWLPVVAFAADEGVGILFDNSGSMKSCFTDEMLQDAQKAVMGLVFNGSYDRSIWTMAAEGKRSKKKIWESGGMIYVHAFGELSSRTEPFFKATPDFAELKKENEARQFIRKELFYKLNFNEKFTHFELAKWLCWWNLCAQLGKGGKNYYMNVLIISDFLPDIQEKFAGAGDEIQNAFITSNAGLATLFRLVHKKRSISKKIPDARLQIHLLHIGPHFIQPKPPPSGQPPSDDQIILKSPRSNYELDPDKAPNIKFAWEVKGKFEKYILEIHSVKPRRKVLIREIQSKQTLVPAKILVSRMESFKSERLVWFVKGVYPEDNKAGKISVTSSHSYLKQPEGGSGTIWILFLILALIAAMIFGLPKLMQAIKRARDKKKKDDLKDDDYKSYEDTDDSEDWDKDIN